MAGNEEEEEEEKEKEEEQHGSVRVLCRRRPCRLGAARPGQHLWLLSKGSLESGVTDTDVSNVLFTASLSPRCC